MSEKTKNKYIAKKRVVFKQLGILLPEEAVSRMKNCSSEVAIDNIARDLIMRHKYTSLRGA